MGQSAAELLTISNLGALSRLEFDPEWILSTNFSCLFFRGPLNLFSQN